MQKAQTPPIFVSSVIIASLVDVKEKIKQDHQALLKAKYCPRVPAASCTLKNTKSSRDLDL